MTPFRSYVVIMGSCVAAVFGKAVGLDSFPVYISVRPLLMQQIMAVNLGTLQLALLLPNKSACQTQPGAYSCNCHL